MPATEQVTKPPPAKPPAEAKGPALPLVLLDKQIFDADGKKVGPEHLTKRAGMRKMYDLSHPRLREKKAVKRAADVAEARKALGAARATKDPEARARALGEAEILARKAGA